MNSEFTYIELHKDIITFTCNGYIFVSTMEIVYRHEINQLLISICLLRVTVVHEFACGQSKSLKAVWRRKEMGLDLWSGMRLILIFINFLICGRNF